MKKTLIAAGIAAVVAAPAVMAEASVYGKLRNAFITGDGNTSSADYSNRFGFKGSEDLGNGMSAYYKMEFNASNDAAGTVTARDRYMGIKGNFGAVQVGDMNSPIKSTYGGNLLEDTIGDKSAILSSDSGYLSSAYAYVSPSFNGLTAIVAAAADNAGDSDTNVRGYALQYKNGPLTLGAGYHNFDDPDSADVTMVSATYTMGDIKVHGIMERADADTSGGTDEDNFIVDVTYKMGNNDLILSYGENDNKASGATNDIDVTTLAVQHNFSKRTNVMVIYNMKDNQTAADVDNVAFQLNHSF